jgi:hypothetical protein
VSIGFFRRRRDLVIFILVTQDASYTYRTGTWYLLFYAPPRPFFREQEVTRTQNQEFQLQHDPKNHEFAANGSTGNHVVDYIGPFRTIFWLEWIAFKFTYVQYRKRSKKSGLR